MPLLEALSFHLQTNNPERLIPMLQSNFFSNRFIITLLGLFFIPLCFNGCQSLMPSEEEKPRYRVELYIDGNLDFSMEHPENWPEVPPTVDEYPQLRQSVRWSSVAEGDRRKGAMVLVTSRHPTEVAGGFSNMVKAYLDSHPQFTALSQKGFDHPAAPAYELKGSEGERTVQVIFLTTPKRAFTVEFSAPSETFDQFIEIFAEILVSFHPLS